MNAIRMITLMACIPQNVRQLMASAFHAPSPQRIIAISARGGAACFHSRYLASRSSTDFLSTNLVSFPTCTHDVSSIPSSIRLLFSTRLYSSPTQSNNDLAIIAEEIDPYSEEAKEALSKFYSENEIEFVENESIDTIHDSLLRLTEQVLSWNARLNLVSRKDCTASVIYHRHVLPSVALLPLILNTKNPERLNVVDVGTGGGFPGLPLALLLQKRGAQFTLVDSVQKKLIAVSEMAAELDMTNVRVHWGRVEEMYMDDAGKKIREHYGRYDVCLGRSVTALPRFCGWVSDLLKKKKNGGAEEGEEGRLVYIIGGELDDLVESRIVQDIPLDQLLSRPEGTSDKRALIFNAVDVEEIATESGEKDRIVRSGPGKNKNKNKNKKGGKKLAKGAWGKKENNVKKQRGYDDFQRYEF